MKIEIAPLAQQQIFEFVEWWDKHRPAARTRVEDAVETALEAIVTAPSTRYDLTLVIPAHAGIHNISILFIIWIPAFAGMTSTIFCLFNLNDRRCTHPELGRRYEKMPQYPW